MERLTFLVEGSKGDEYTLNFEIDGARANAFCTCPAGENGQYCKHRFAIMDGDTSRLLSSNAEDAERLRAMLVGTDLASAHDRVVTATRVAAEAERELNQAKKELAKAMYR